MKTDVSCWIPFGKAPSRPVDSRTGMGGGMDSQYKLLSDLLSDQAAFITSPKTSLANYWGGHCPYPLPPAPVSTDLPLFAVHVKRGSDKLHVITNLELTINLVSKHIVD